MLPIVLITVVPMLLISAIVYVLRPQGEVAVAVEEPWTKNHNKTYRPTTYVSSTWGKKPAFKYQTQEDPKDPNPIYDELEVLMRESEARMEADVAAALTAHKILIELGMNVRKSPQLV